MKIVVIEDNPEITEIMDYILKDDGYEVISSEDGSITNKFVDIKPDLVLMDELLPGKRGSELCRSIKDNDAIKHIPVILVSTMPNLEQLAEKSGADGFLEKPFNISSLSALIKDFAEKLRK
ncbi:response regulator [Mucilaginibacter daejeonensis]|uniref:response regulator n=1 Tax=Mucilaginibacter daejeonensis TaxID=398049 RepID=UPI001D177984|nr:response regulator [Mucilaginibacter daejeonensis]UEG54555.1 response regulator [Mucilaginibacter daejeonensis]